MTGKSRGIGKARMCFPNAFAHCGPQVRANAVGATLVNGVAAGAFFKDFLALGRVRRLHQQRNGRFSRGATIGPAFRTRDFKAARFNRVMLENLTSHNCRTQCDNACCQCPSSDGVKLIAHARRNP